MRLPQFGVKYPVTTTMIFSAMIILGLVSLSMLGLDMMPDIEIPAISVITTYEGAGPEEVESKITKVLEDNLATVQNLDKIVSQSAEGVSTITLQFDWGTNLDESANDVRDMVDISNRYLPEDIDRPIIFKFDLSMMPILVLTVIADESYSVLYDLIDDRVCDPLKTVPGVATAVIRGGLEREILVALNRSRLEAYHLSVDQVINALRQENLDIPGGHIKTGQKEYLIRTPEEIEVNEIENIAVTTTKDGVSIYIKDIAVVKDAFKEQTQKIEVNGQTGLIVAIQKQSGANTVQVAERVLKKLEELKKNLPPDVKITAARDFSEFIKNSLGNLRDALIWGICFVLIIILFFLRDLRAGLIIASAIPTSLIVTFLLIYTGGYTLNIISVSSLAIAMGMVVDAGIVVLDNIHRHRMKGERPKEAAIFGASEVGKAITASTLTTVAIFVPIVFVGGITGIMFKEMAFVICLALLTSLFTALTLIPMLSSKFLYLREGKKSGKNSFQKIYAISERWFEHLEQGYKNYLHWALSHRKTVITGGFLILLFSLLLLPLVGTRFMSEVDANMFRGYVELPVGTRLEETGKVIKDIQDVIIKEVPEKTVMFTQWGYSSGHMARVMGGDQGSNTGLFMTRLISKEERERSVHEIVDKIRSLIANRYPGAEVRFSEEDPLSGMLFAEGKPFVIELYGHDMREGMKTAEKIATELKKIRGIVDVDISRKMGKPELQIRIDRDKASHLGLHVSDVGNTIQIFFSGKNATKYREKGKEYDIFVRLQEKDRQHISDLKNSFISSPAGKQIRLANVAEIIEEFGPVTIERKNQQRVIHITANLSGRDLGSAVKEASQRLAKIEIPKDFFVDFGGEREEQREAFGFMTMALFLGMMLVYMVMASQFESLRDPFIILFSIPFGMVGVVLVHLIFRQIFNVNSFIGLIMIVGIVVNNAIVLISYINILRARGLSVREAVAEGGRTRLRPVIMTSLTTTFALLPLVFSKGEGSEEWVTLGLTVIGGLLFSVITTLIFIPTLYSIFEDRRGISLKTIIDGGLGGKK